MISWTTVQRAGFKNTIWPTNVHKISGFLQNWLHSKFRCLKKRPRREKWRFPSESVGAGRSVGADVLELLGMIVSTVKSQSVSYFNDRDPICSFCATSPTHRCADRHQCKVYFTCDPEAHWLQFEGKAFHRNPLPVAASAVLVSAVTNWSHRII